MPALDGSAALPQLVAAIVCLAVALPLAARRMSRALAFCLALSLLMVGWEGGKFFADSVSYKILLPQASWQYRALPSLEAALQDLQAGAVHVVIADRKDLDDLMPPQPPDDDGADADLPYPDLRYFKQLDRSAGVAFLPITPAFRGGSAWPCAPPTPPTSAPRAKSSTAISPRSRATLPRRVFSASRAA